MPTASLPKDFIYSSALGNAEFLRAQRLLRSVLVPALSETSIPTSNAFLQSPLQTLNCRMIQGSLSSQISVYSQKGAASPRVFQSTATGCPVLDSMTVSLPNNSASHRKIMIQAEKWQEFLKTEKVILFAFLRTLMSGIQAAPLQPWWQHIFDVIEVHVGTWFLTLSLLQWKTLIYYNRKVQKTADGEVFLLSCRLFMWQLGSL